MKQNQETAGLSPYVHVRGQAILGNLFSTHGQISVGTIFRAALLSVGISQFGPLKRPSKAEPLASILMSAVVTRPDYLGLVGVLDRVLLGVPVMGTMTCGLGVLTIGVNRS